MWKPVIFLAVFGVFISGVSAGRFALKGSKREKVQESVEQACKEFGNYSQQNQVLSLTMGAIGCIYESFDKVIDNPAQSKNTTAREDFLESVTRFCEIRQTLRECAQQLLDYLAPCTAEPVKAQVAEKKAAITELFRYFCDDDMAQTRSFVNDGAIECIDNKKNIWSNCTYDVRQLFIEIPDDARSFEAIMMCQKYDTMVSCVLDTLSDCPKPSTKEFVHHVFELFRSGTFCRATAPVQPAGNDI